MFLDISAIINRKKQEKVNSGFGIYEVYDNNTVISILKGIDQKKPGAVFFEKFSEPENNGSIFVATKDTAEIMSCFKANKNLFPADAVPCFLGNGQLVIVKKEEPATINQKHITDLSVRVNKFISTISITFNEEGKQKFAVLSKANTTKMLARMYGNRLISCPRVLSEIPSGRVEVTGDFHWIDLVEIAISIKE